MVEKKEPISLARSALPVRLLVCLPVGLPPRWLWLVGSFFLPPVAAGGLGGGEGKSPEIKRHGHGTAVKRSEGIVA